MSDKYLIRMARWISSIFSPFYMPLVGMVILFIFSYMSILPFFYKLMIVIMVYCFTIALPKLGIYSYRRIKGWSSHQVGHRERRLVPYCISILSFAMCFCLMDQMRLPHFIKSILITALLLQVVCAIINNWWKISMHTAATGAITGTLLGFSVIFLFNPVWWLCLTLLISGLVGSCRIILHLHRLSQVAGGFFIGLLLGFFGVFI